MSVFPGANHTVINGGQFNATANVINNHSGHNDVVSILLSHSATAGLLNASERFDAPKCDENTRVSILQELKKWVKTGNSSSSSSMYWIHGPAGVGKSALAQSLALLLEMEGDHAASFFCSRTAAGRNNGSQLVTTLACQLAMNFPAIQPFIADSIKRNPIVFTSSNAVQMQKLIVDPINQARKSRSYRWRKLPFSDRWNHPRLILVDGLDECDDPVVQRDFILIIGHAVQDLRLPFRFIIASRPESHILSTFELDPLFQGPGSVNVIHKNLGEDPDADENIITYLCKEFNEIRRTHPLRNYLPPIWPQPEDIDQLAAKSSKGFIYPATVIRYIKLPHNRPEECLKRILGMSDIPSHDKPYEPLDNLYRHIFTSVPDINKKSIKDMFDILVIPRTIDDDLGVFTTPHFIENLLNFEPGHVSHVLGDLLCVVAISDSDTPIKLLHASLADFLLDPTRSGDLHTDIGRAHEMIARGYYRIFVQSSRLFHWDFDVFLNHSKRSLLSEELMNDLATFDLVDRYRRAYATHPSIDSPHQESFPVFVDFTISVAAFLLLLQRKDFQDGGQVLSQHIRSIEKYIIDRLPAAQAVYDLQTDIIPGILPLLPSFYAQQATLSSHFEDIDYARTPGNIGRAQILTLIPIFSCPQDAIDINLPPEPKYARLAEISLKFISRYVFFSKSNSAVPIVVDFLLLSLSRASYSSSLVSALAKITDGVPELWLSILRKDSDVLRLAPKVINYLRRFQSDIPPDQFSHVELVWKDLGGFA